MKSFKIDISGYRKPVSTLAVLHVLKLLVIIFDCTSGHGRLWEPPSRSSMWRRGYNTTININDNELSCGGFTNQWIKYSGLCGVCGDPYQQYPRDNEIGGKYASGIVTRTYPIGRTIDVTIELTANHMGYFEFKLCPILDPASGETQLCMDKHQLKILNGEDNGYRFYVRDQTLDGFIDLTLILPNNFLCKHCVLQWKYRTGTRWGCDSDLKCGAGKGPQEEFYGCSDISVQDVSKTIYNEPDMKTDEKTGYDHLGATKTHTVIWSIKPTLPQNFQTSSFANNQKVSLYTITYTPSSLSHRHNKHMASLRHFLEELTLNALISYYGKKDKNKTFRCSPALKYQRNPIVNEFCIKMCSHDSTVCPEILCTCSNIPVSTAEQKETYQRKHHKLNRNHLKNFARELILKNKLVENIPTDVTEKVHKRRNLNHDSLRRRVNVPRLGRMELINYSDKRLPIFHDDRKSSKALQESNFIPFHGVQHHIGNRHMTHLITSKGLEFPSLDPDKIVPLPSQEIIKPQILICTASISFAHNPFMAKWCNTNCQFGFCPPRVCSCNY